MEASLKKIQKLKISIEDFILVISVFLLTMLISPYYIYGDQETYHNIYAQLQGLSLRDGYAFYILHLDSKEIIHFFISWLASNQGVDKDLLMACFNAIFAFVSVKLMRKLNASIWIIALLLLTNFYFYILYFAGERLKFGFLFLFFALVYTKRFYIFSLLSILSHSQMIIIYISILAKVFSNRMSHIFSIKMTKKNLFVIVILLPIIIFMIFSILSGHLVSKFQHYNELREHGLVDIVKIFVLFVLTLWYSKNKREVVFIFVPLIIAAYLVGGERVNMMGYFIFLYYALPIRKGFNIGVLITSFYFLFVTYGFVLKILEHGNGFYGN